MVLVGHVFAFTGFGGQYTRWRALDAMSHSDLSEDLPKNFNAASARTNRSAIRASKNRAGFLIKSRAENLPATRADAFKSQGERRKK